MLSGIPAREKPQLSIWLIIQHRILLEQAFCLAGDGRRGIDHLHGAAGDRPNLWDDEWVVGAGQYQRIGARIEQGLYTTGQDLVRRLYSRIGQPRFVLPGRARRWAAPARPRQISLRPTHRASPQRSWGLPVRPRRRSGSFQPQVLPRAPCQRKALRGTRAASPPGWQLRLCCRRRRPVSRLDRAGSG